MSYLNIISLEEAKEYLGVNDDAQDRQITRMIRSSLMYVEQHSNHIFYTRDKEYNLRDSCARVHDYPINAVVAPDPDTTVATQRALYTDYRDGNTANDTITLNVGYQYKDDIPEVLVEAAYMILEHYYNEKEDKVSKMPHEALELIGTFKRHIF